ncbi:transglutaminase domain-containing protein [Adlercreutzia sp. R21]|nr:transglutaminase domain-containing protein [Adlercreutzia sp. R21]MEC4185359.1 transglutaminase domain-containing protein [Adlercreutzia sp. R21]
MAIAAVLAACIAPSVAWAADDAAVVSEAAERVVAQYDNTASKPTSQVGLSVSWDDPICGQPTEFSVATTNGSSQCEYRIDSVNRYTDDRKNYLEWVMDPSKFVYQASPSFQLTFCASGTYRVRISVLDKGASPLVYENVDAWVVVDDPAHPSVETVADRVASDCLKAGNATDFDKALWLHDWIIANCEYDHSLTYCGAEGVFARGTGTCESYHRAYEMLLARVGISTGRITGNGHVWTAVKLDGKWYQVDATWDDAQQFSGYPDLRHLYFGMDDNIVSLVHPDHTQPVAGYESSSLEQNYFVKTGEIRAWSDPYVQRISQKLGSGEEHFSIPIDHASWPDDYKNAFYNVVAYDLSQRTWAVGAAKEVKVTYASNSLSVAVSSKDTQAPSDSTGSGTVNRPPTQGSLANGSTASSPIKSTGVWKKSKGKWWYRHADGSYTRNGWELIDGVWYHFDRSGWMQTGWLKTGGKWYYLASSGAMKTGWLKTGGKWYYLRASGAMATGWYQVRDTWYWSAFSGAMGANRWVGNYYLTKSGAMATNTWVGKYHVNGSGKWDRTR